MIIPLFDFGFVYECAGKSFSFVVIAHLLMTQNRNLLKCVALNVPATYWNQGYVSSGLIVCVTIGKVSVAIIEQLQFRETLLYRYPTLTILIIKLKLNILAIKKLSPNLGRHFIFNNLTLPYHRPNLIPVFLIYRITDCSFPLKTMRARSDPIVIW